MQPRFGSHSRAAPGPARGRVAEYKIVVLGAGGVGKSCLTAQFVQNMWIEEYDPTIEDIYRKQLEVDGRQCVLEIMDTAGTEQFTAMRELYLTTGHGFLLVFSITSLNSLLELAELREQIIRIKDDTNTPIVLVGNKSDLEEDRAVSRARAFAVSQSWGNAPYYETSARYRTNVDDVFRDLCRQIMRQDPSVMSSSGTARAAGLPPTYRDREQLPNGVGSGGGGGRHGGGGGGGGHVRTGTSRRTGRKASRRRDDRPFCTIL